MDDKIQKAAALISVRNYIEYMRNALSQVERSKIQAASKLLKSIDNLALDLILESFDVIEDVQSAKKEKALYRAPEVTVLKDETLQDINRIKSSPVATVEDIKAEKQKRAKEQGVKTNNINLPVDREVAKVKEVDVSDVEDIREIKRARKAQSQK